MTRQEPKEPATAQVRCLCCSVGPWNEGPHPARRLTRPTATPSSQRLQALLGRSWQPSCSHSARCPPAKQALPPLREPASDRSATPPPRQGWPGPCGPLLIAVFWPRPPHPRLPYSAAGTCRDTTWTGSLIHLLLLQAQGQVLPVTQKARRTAPHTLMHSHHRAFARASALLGSSQTATWLAPSPSSSLLKGHLSLREPQPPATLLVAPAVPAAKLREDPCREVCTTAASGTSGGGGTPQQL